MQSFRKLLLHKCQEEFQNRRRATADFEARRGDILSAEEEEQRGIAKRKMLGNIKFVGEVFTVLVFCCCYCSWYAVAFCLACPILVCVVFSVQQFLNQAVDISNKLVNIY